ncbi:MAG: filamentous hemagglutinin N-terminal domain-containing protein, partial [Cyanobacteria bacterium J06656_5]
MSALSAQAQIMPDGTLSSTVSSLDGQNFIIDNGDRTGNNLFHSFDTFSVPTNGSAVFNNPTDIENIFSRVTGPNLSNIDGLLQANGTTNLFLLNPNGIFFGENASLNIGGSFVASTAERILFSDTVEFSAVNGAPAPLLTVSTPVGLGFGTNPKPITVAGPGHNMLLNFSTSIPIQNNRPVGLQVDAGETLALVGGDILVEGGNLTANQGRIELGSVAQSGTVSLTPVADGLTFDYDVIGLGDIRFTQSASVDVSGEGGGNLSFQAGSLAVLNGSAIISNVLGDDDGGEIIIRASDSLEIRGTPFGSFPTGFFNQGEVNSTGQVGEMIFDVGMLIIDNAQIRSTAMGQGDGGSLIIQANDVDLSGFSTDIVVETGLGSEGDGGDINLQVAETLRVTNFAELGSRTLGQGNGGSVDIQAKNIELSGFSTNIFAETGLGTEGDGGDINLQVAETLRVTNFSDISTRTLGQGNGGSVDIQANDIELSGSGSGIFSETSLESEGDAGDISLQIVDRLQVTESAKIRSTTFGIGDGGSLDIQASNIELRGSGSDILTRTDSRAEGNAGSIDLQVANRLQVTERAEINSTTLGSGDGGSIDIESSDIEVSNRAGIFAETRSDTEGNAGRIDLQVVETLQVTEGAEISNASFGPGNGAPIVIRANDIELSGFFSGISAETASDVGGDAGNIDLQVVETLLILDDAEISNTT